MRHFGKTVAVIFVILSTALVAQGQTTVKVGFSLGFYRHTFSANSSAGYFQPGIGLSGTYGIPIVIKRNKWELHTGFFSNNLSRSFYFTFPAGGTVGKNSFSSGLSSYKIPLLIGRTIQWTENISLSPQVGFSWLTSRRIGRTGKGRGSYGSRVEYTFKTEAVNKNKFMAEFGLDVNFSIFRNLTLKIGAQYSLGLQPMQKADVTYTINQQTYHGTLTSKGSGWKFNIGLLFPLFSF